MDPSANIYAKHHAQQMYQTYGHQMGSLNAFGIGASSPSTFFYMGNVIGLESKLQDVQTQTVPITDVTINVTGNQIKEANFCCLILTTLLGGILIFPLFFMCCGWWKRMVNPAYSVPISTYHKLQALINNQTVRTVSISVCDSTFDQTKANLLYTMLSRSNLKGFSFSNIAPANNLDGNEWSDFKSHMKPIKTLSMMTQIKWWGQVVL